MERDGVILQIVFICFWEKVSNLKTGAHFFVSISAAPKFYINDILL